MLKYLAAITSVLAISTGSALAADPLYLPVSVYNWTGWYVGGSVGYGWGKANSNPSFHLDPPVAVTDNDTVVFSVLGGYRWHMPNNVVYGAQLAIPFGSDGGSGNGGGGSGVNTVKGVFAMLGTGQIGFAHGRWLPLGTAGLGFVTAKSTATSPNGSATATHPVWTVGFGVDYALLDNVVVGARYNYVGIVKAAHEHGVVPPTNSFGLNGHVVSAVATWRLGR